MKDNISFILVNPQLGENIGFAARALKNFGFSKLLLVNPRDKWPSIKAINTSANASNIIKSTKLIKNTQTVVKNFDIIFSFTSRNRKLNKKQITIKQIISIIKKNKKKKIGMMFGSESSGLNNFDISLSNYIVQIPTCKNYKSLNLAQSVVITCYELFNSNLRAFKLQKNFNSKASKSRINDFLSILRNKLDKVNFFKPSEKKKSMIENLYNLFHKMEIDDKELRILLSIIGALEKKKIKHN